MKFNLAEIFLEKSGIKQSFDDAYQTFVEMAEANEPLPKIAQAVAPHARPVVQQFTKGWMAKGKLQAAAAAVNWKLSRVSVDEIETFLDKARQEAGKDASQHSKDAMDVAQKFLDGLNPELIQEALDSNKGAITSDMIEDVIVLVKAVKSVLPPKLDSYLQDLIPEIDELEDIIRREAEGFITKDSGDQIRKVFDAARDTTERDHNDLLKNGQSDVLQKLEEIEPEQIKRMLDYVGEQMTRKKIHNLMNSFFHFAEEVIDAFEDGTKPLREYDFQHGEAYREAISEFLQYVEEALDAEGILPDKLDVEQIRKSVQDITGQKPSANKSRGPRP